MEAIVSIPGWLAVTGATPAGSVAFGFLSIILLVVACRRAWGTTLVAPCCWAIACVTCITLVETGIGLAGQSLSVATGSILRYLAATLAICPAVSVLGAKRPQYVVWQLIVLSLWAILVLPAMEALILSPGSELRVDGARSWFLLILLLIGAANYVATRFGFVAVLGSLGQVGLLSEPLPLISLPWGMDGVVVGLSLVLTALTLALCGFPRRAPSQRAMDEVWCDFRDMYGSLWALRVSERVNVAGRAAEMEVSLGWHGIQGVPPGADSTALDRHLKSLLRRFVSREWIARRLGKSVD